jgi:hypothetical protein
MLIMTDIKSFHFDSFSFGFRFDAKGFHSRPKVKIPKVKSKLKAGETTNQSFENHIKIHLRCSLNQGGGGNANLLEYTVEWEPFFEFLACCVCNVGVYQILSVPRSFQHL